MTGFVPTQVALERRALALLARPDVRAGIRAQAQRWRAGTPGFLPETYAQLDAAAEEVALLVALQVVNGDPRRPRVVEISAGPHTWGGLDVPGGRWGINNPDTVYLAVPVEPASGYVLRGRVRGAAPTDLNVSVQLPDVWSTLAALGRADLAPDDDGGFTITLGTAPAGPNHLPIAAGGAVVVVRQTLGDWTTELPYDLTVDRVAGPAAGPPATEDDLAAELVRRLAVVVDHNVRSLQAPIVALPVNTVPQPGPAGDKPGYLVAQRNALGHFRLADDEGLLVEITPGGAGYAAVAAPGIWGVTTDSARHRNSLNSLQAQPGSDGRITAVVANADPGVVDWVDPGGLREGILMLRWQLLDRHPHDGQGPGVAVRLVRLADLPGRSAVGPTDRARHHRDRAAGYARRFDAR